MVVSATRTPMEASKVASTVNVLSPEQVQQSPAREAQDMLREIPAVELPRTSSLVGGTAQIVSIRGVDEGRTGVLFDGVPINDAWGEWIDWGRVPKSMLDRVEVVEGGTSSLYGNGAMGGMISFFSRPMAPGSMDLSVEGGSRDARHAYIAAGVPLVGALTASINGDYQEKGGYRIIRDSSIVDPSSTIKYQPAGPADVISNVIQRNSYSASTTIRRRTGRRSSPDTCSAIPAAPARRSASRTAISGTSTLASITTPCSAAHSASARGTVGRSRTSVRRRCARCRASGRAAEGFESSRPKSRATIGARRCSGRARTPGTSSRSASVRTSGIIRETSTKSTSARPAAHRARVRFRSRSTCRRAATNR
jgi:outer membrane receptor protein involved in Fe transport